MIRIYVYIYIYNNSNNSNNNSRPRPGARPGRGALPRCRPPRREAGRGCYYVLLLCVGISCIYYHNVSAVFIISILLNY